MKIREHMKSYMNERSISSREADYIINEPGSALFKYPDKLQAGDTLYFNITNKDIDTKYSGSMITYTFPTDCTVLIYAAGARGGMGNKATLATTGHGAFVSGLFNFKKGDTLLMCVGQAGTDFVGSYSDGTSGAGGGGTFITLKMNDGTGDTYNGTGTGNGWKVKPLLIAAGGNGSRDVGYSGSGTVYHGQGIGGSAPTYTTYAGGGYSSSHTATNAGKSFLSGASGATAKYTRKSYSVAGFGCGGGNIDDGEGGGGGGYFGGLRTRSAYSYINTSYTSTYSSTPGDNDGEGYIQFGIIESASDGAKIKANVNGTWKESSEVKVNVNGTWKKATKIFTKVNGAWKEGI